MKSEVIQHDYKYLIIQTVTSNLKFGFGSRVKNQTCFSIHGVIVLANIELCFKHALLSFCWYNGSSNMASMSKAALLYLIMFTHLHRCRKTMDFRLMVYMLGITRFLGYIEGV